MILSLVAKNAKKAERDIGTEKRDHKMDFAKQVDRLLEKNSVYIGHEFDTSPAVKLAHNTISNKRDDVRYFLV